MRMPLSTHATHPHPSAFRLLITVDAGLPLEALPLAPAGRGRWLVQVLEGTCGGGRAAWQGEDGPLRKLVVLRQRHRQRVGAAAGGGGVLLDGGHARLIRSGSGGGRGRAWGARRHSRLRRLLRRCCWRKIRLVGGWGPAGAAAAGAGARCRAPGRWERVWQRGLDDAHGRRLRVVQHLDALRRGGPPKETRGGRGAAGGTGRKQTNKKRDKINKVRGVTQSSCVYSRRH